MTLICAGDTTVSSVEQALSPLGADGRLTVTVREVPEEHVDRAGGSAWVLTVHGGDRPGIVSAMAHEISRVGGNISDLTTRLAGDLYVVAAELDLPDSADVPALEGVLRDAAQQLGVAVTLRAAEADDL
jgi:glycine cleavage system transcriptional repressor